jgi:hypothetical protein
MLLVSLLVISLVLLFGFSMSREKGKNTKFARKGANAIAQKRETTQSINTSEVIEIN